MKTLLSFIFSIFLVANVFSQESLQYVVTFKDKLNSPFSVDRPEEFLSQKAINRRLKQGISIDETDLPLSHKYLKDIASIPALTIKSSSKWFNDVIVQWFDGMGVGANDSSIIAKINSKPYVKEVRRIHSSKDKSKQLVNKKLDTELIEAFDIGQSSYGAAYRQVSMMNADYLHALGYRGEGMRIAVIDGGFTGVWVSKHFDHLYKDQRIIDIYDFVDKDDSIYNHSNHGNYVLSTIASYSPGTMIGTAPYAEFILLRSEDGAAEYVLEEYFWTEAAEFADSAGADIINTSLGYTTFDDSLENHIYADMDGKTTRITKSSTIAHQKGMLLFTSAGNSGNSSWQKINAPSDELNTITVGAVDSLGELADFSSRGPTADNRIKPDVVTMGKLAAVGKIDGSATFSNGTSFSSPILSGAAACLWQANPTKTWEEVRSALIMSANRYNSPDTNYGHGIPDMIKADALLKGISSANAFGSSSLRAFPNPFQNELMIVLRLTKSQYVDVNWFNLEGQLVASFKKRVEGGQSGFLYFSKEVSNFGSGMYFVKISAEGLEEEIKVIKE